MFKFGFHDLNCNLYHLPTNREKLLVDIIDNQEKYSNKNSKKS